MTNLPEGFLFRPDFLTTEEESSLLDAIRPMDLHRFQMRGVWSNRRIAHFGFKYSFDDRKLSQGEPIPEAFLPVRAKLAQAAEIDAGELAEALVTEYSPGAGIGWHRDAPGFGIVAAVSLLGSCRMRFRKGEETTAIELPPSSMYLISGTARKDWEHTIPSTKELRYSLTFRTLKRRVR